MSNIALSLCGSRARLACFLPPFLLNFTAIESVCVLASLMAIIGLEFGRNAEVVPSGSNGVDYNIVVPILAGTGRLK